MSVCHARAGQKSSPEGQIMLEMLYKIVLGKMYITEKMFEKGAGSLHLKVGVIAY